MPPRRFTAVTTGFGALYVTSEQQHIVRITSERPTIADGLQVNGDPVLTRAADSLRDYLNGYTCTPDFQFNACFSAFQQRVFDGVRRVPYGTAVTLDELADTLGLAASKRAVEMICRCNPLWIAIPTHRILIPEDKPSSLLSPAEALRRMEARYRRLNLS